MSAYDLSGYTDVAERIRQLRAKHPLAVLRPYDPANPFRIVEIGGREFIVYTAACYRTPDDLLPAIACSAEPVLGTTNFTRNSELMNAETSAWGRAIMAALAVDEPHIASADEVRNRKADGEAAYEKIKPQQSPEHPAMLRRAAAIQAATDADAPPVEQTQAEIVLAAFAGSTVAPAAQPSGSKVVQLRVAASEKQIATIGKIARERNIDDIAGYCSNIIGRQIDDISTLVAREASAVLKAMIGK